MATDECSSYLYTDKCSRNPSPPPLTENEKEVMSADYIGGTLFSKSFILGLLLKLYKHEKEDMYLNINIGPCEKTEEIGDCLLTKFENEVCELWDSSSNSEVAMFIFENHGKDIFMDVIEKTTCTRLTEISFGILGNLMCVDDINECFSQDASFRNTMLGYLRISDALSLVELTRMINICFSSGESSSLWMNTISTNTSAMENLVNILQNSLNVQLLQHIIQLIDVIFDSDAELMDKYADSSLFYAVNESYRVIRSKNQELVADLLYILQLVSTTEKGVQQLAVDNSIFLLLRQCIFDEQNLFVEKKPSLLVSVYSVLGCLLFAKPLEIITLINENINVLQYLITILHDCVTELINENDNEIVPYDSDLYVPVYLEVFHDICQIFCTHEGNNFANIVGCLKGCELQIKDIFQQCNREDIPLEWKRFFKNLLVLNKQHCMLSFVINLNY